MVAFSSITVGPTWVVTACMLYMISLLFLFLKWWQMHPKYGKNIGPPVLPIVGSFLSLVKNQDHMYEWATELLRQSPSLTIRNVLFGLDIYTTANPANVEYMLKTKFHNYTKGFRFQNLMEDMLGNGIFNVDGELWKAQRKAASYEFTSNSLKTMMLDVVQKEVANRLLPLLYNHMCRASYNALTNFPCCRASGNSSSCTQNRSSCRAPIDLQDIFLRFTFDNICQISLGVDPACLNHSLEDDSFAKAFDDATEMIILRFYTPAWVWQFKRLLNVGSEKQLKKALHVVHSFAEDIIKRRKHESICGKDNGMRPQHGDLLFRLLPVTARSQGAERPDELTSKVSEDNNANREFHEDHTDAKSDALLRDMVISFLVAGRDTSSIALSWFFWLLIQHPRVEADIYKEITSVRQASRKSKYACLRKLESHHEVCESRDKYPGGDFTSDVDNCQGDAHEVNKKDSTVRKHDDEGHGDGVGDMSTCKQQGVGEGDHQTFNEGHVDDDGNQLSFEAFTYEELKEMKYLQAALQEAMRLYPPVPHDTKLVVEEDVLPDGTRLRAGAQLAYHAYAMGRMESIWGEDWARFRPERWMQEQNTVSPFKWPVFQAGPRICLGKEMAMLQMKCVAAAIIQRFTMAVPAGFHEPRYSLSFTLKMQQGLPVHLHPRLPVVSDPS